MKNFLFIILSLSFCTTIYSQSDTMNVNAGTIFEKISRSLESYEIDTSTPPDDKLTRMILKLRNLGGGFNIDEAIDFKIDEDRKKGEIPTTEINALADYFKTGHGKILLHNAITWIYRNHFSYKEVKDLVKFYNSSSGKKLTKEFPLVMLKSMAAAEMIKGNFKSP